VIYCVIPEALAGELYDKLTDYYKDDPNVEVIIDRRTGDRRGRKGPEDVARESEQRVVRDRRRRRPGSFPGIDAG
jgi:hypothetical protein